MPGQPMILAHGLSVLLLIMSVQVNADDNGHYDRIHLSASAQQEVENDILTAELSARQVGEDLPALTDAVNRTITQAVKRSQQVSDVRVSTLAYQTHPRYQKQRLIGWQVRQAIQLQSANIDALSQLLGKLQNDLAIDSLSYTVSPSRREDVEQALTTQAIERFKQRAENVTRQLGRKKYRLVDMHINTEGQPVRPVSMRSLSVMEESRVAAPQVEPGTQTLRVTITASIELVVK